MRVDTRKLARWASGPAAMEAMIGEAVAAERERCRRAVAETSIPLVGFDRFPERDTFAGFNIGRLVEAIDRAIREG